MPPKSDPGYNAAEICTTSRIQCTEDADFASHNRTRGGAEALARHMGWLETGGLAPVTLVLIGCKPDGARRHIRRTSAPLRRLATSIRDLHTLTLDQAADMP